MSLARWSLLPALGVALLALACGGGGGGGGGGGTEPPGPPTQLLKRGGDGQSWYFNNPLPMPYSVTVRDANGRVVPEVSVGWTITTGDGGLSPNPSTTNPSGVASTLHTLGTASTYAVTAAVTGLPSVTFTGTASAPPTTANVSVENNRFNPENVYIKTGGTVTWTWNSGGLIKHDVIYSSGPMPLPASSELQASGTHSNTITTVGTYNYYCSQHAQFGMTGSVTVVN